MATEKIQIPAANTVQMKVTIKGLTPVIFHKWDEKAIKMIEDKQQKKATKGRETRNPEAEYEASFYYDSEGRIAIPARNIKQAIVGSARFLPDVKMTILRGTIFVWGDADGMIPVIYKEKDKTMRRDMVTVGMGTADVRYRGQISNWSMTFLIEYDADLLSASQVINLLQRAGRSQGLMEWRPEKNGDNGMFSVETKADDDE